MLRTGVARNPVRVVRAVTGFRLAVLAKRWPIETLRRRCDAAFGPAVVQARERRAGGILLKAFASDPGGANPVGAVGGRRMNNLVRSYETLAE
jgi:hypothetical protein